MNGSAGLPTLGILQAPGRSVLQAPRFTVTQTCLYPLRGAALEASFDDARQEAAVRGRAWLGQGPHEEGRWMRAGWGGCGLVLGGRGRGKQGKGYK